MNQAAHDKLRTLRQRLAALEPYPWEPVAAWIASATPLITAHYRDHSNDFLAVAATPRWHDEPTSETHGGRFGSRRNNNAAAEVVEEHENRGRATAGKARILAFVDGLLDVPPFSEQATRFGVEVNAKTEGDVSQGSAGSSPPEGAVAPSVESASTQPATDTAIDVAILTAIEVERRAVCTAFGLRKEHRVRKDGRTYWRGKLTLTNDEHYEILVAQLRDMGQVEAALLASDIIRHFRPSAALLVGIAASTRPDEAKLGDVVIGRSVYYYEHGKVTPEGTKPQPEMILADAALTDAAVNFDWEGAVPNRPDGSEVQPQRHLGVIASGEKVIASAAARDVITAPNRKILALEMEGYGFSRAVWQSFEPVRHLDIRGICDDGSEKKDDRWHKYAAAAAAGFTRHFLADRPLEPKNRRMERAKSAATAPLNVPQGKAARAPGPLTKRQPDISHTGPSAQAYQGGIAIAAGGNAYFAPQYVAATTAADVEQTRVRCRYALAIVCALCLSSVVCFFLHYGGIGLLFLWTSIGLHAATVLYYAWQARLAAAAQALQRTARRVVFAYLSLALLAEASSVLVINQMGVPLDLLAIQHLPVFNEHWEIGPGYVSRTSSGSSGSGASGGMADDGPFDCGDGQKVPSNGVCDGERDCKNGADEEPAMCRDPKQCCVAAYGCREEPLNGTQKFCDCCPKAGYVCCLDPRLGCCRGSIYGRPEP